MSWYDTEEGIRAAVDKGLPGLHELARERHKAGYDRKEHLDQWCVLGLYVMDSCGNFSKLVEGAPYSQRSEKRIPPVMTYEQINRYTDRWTAAHERCLPPVVETCDRCLRGWDMNNIHDFYRPQREKDSPRHYVCQTLAVIQNGMERFQEILKASEMPHTSMRAIPNEYYTSDPAWFGPWFIVETDKGPLRIGSRKSVINIDWSQTKYNHNGDYLFSEENVTKDDAMIHAHGKDKAIEYLRKLSRNG
jgi:hypothetical protein